MTTTIENGPMEDRTEQIIIDRLDMMSSKIENTNERIHSVDKTLSSFMVGAKDCRAKCLKTHDAVYGNGTPGLKAKMWVVWGLLGVIGSAVLAVIKGWVGQ